MRERKSVGAGRGETERDNVDHGMLRSWKMWIVV